jgi:hypothetical protein
VTGHAAVGASSATPAPAEGPPLERGTLLVHVPFHFVPRRWPYLRDVLAAFAEYRMAAVQVVVDTNSPEAEELVRTLPAADRRPVRVEVHRDLAHPFDLTWAGRRHMASALEEFDYFVYVEDDILVPWEAFEAWSREEACLGRRNFVRGFLRVERDAVGRTVSTDWLSPLRAPLSMEMDGRRYVRPAAFYQACWAASRDRMRRFVASESWTRGFHRWSSVRRAHRSLGTANYVREYSAFGWSCALAGRPRVLLPLDGDGRIARSAWIWHLPNNYGMDPSQPGGRLAAEDLIAQAAVPAESVRGRLLRLRDSLLETLRWAAFLLRLDVAWRAADGGVRRTARRVRALVRGGPAEDAGSESGGGANSSRHPSGGVR